MITNYLKIALRNLRRRPGNVFINIMGLTTGLASCLLIGLFVQDELLHDQQHPYKERLYRVNNLLSRPEGEIRVAITPAIYGEKIREDYPEVEQFARIHPISSDLPVQYDDERFFETGAKFWYTDSSFFDLFGFSLAKGDPGTVLTRPFSIVLTPQLAEKYFGDENPIGKSLLLNETNTFTVTGVLLESPKRSHLSFQALLSMASLHEMGGQKGPGGIAVYGTGGMYFTNWHFAASYTYVRLTPRASAQSLEAKLPGFIARYLPESFHDQYRPFLQPVTDIHLYSEVLYDLSENSDVAYIYIFSAAAFFVLLIGCVNYVNLSTARSMQRAREVGIRKVLGAQRKQLIGQFLGESILLTLLAMIVAFELAWFCLPFLNTISAKAMSLRNVMDPLFLLGLVVIAFFVSIGAGAYPAFFLANIQPIKTLNRRLKSLAGFRGLRKGLVVFQFSMSVVLLISTGIVYQQLKFVQDKDLGFEKEYVVVVKLANETTQARYEVFKKKLSQHPNVLKIASSSAVPGDWVARHDVQPEGTPAGKSSLMALYAIDYDFIETMGFGLADGRAFSQDFSTDSTRAYLLNEAAVAQLGWQNDPIGREFTWRNPKKGPQKGRIIGVIKDFHYQPLRIAIQPAAFTIAPEWYEYLSIRISSNNVKKTLDFLETEWKVLAPGRPFDYTFLDDMFGSQYKAEERFGLIVGMFTLVALVVACLGLFGLVSFMVDRRTQEIGVRKVLGASVSNIVLLFSKDFAKLVLIASILATPFAYFGMERWLEKFVYRIEVEPGIFFIAGLLVLFVALLTVSYQSINAALANPVKSLRNE